MSPEGPRCRRARRLGLGGGRRHPHDMDGLAGVRLPRGRGAPLLRYPDLVAQVVLGVRHCEGGVSVLVVGLGGDGWEV